MRAFLVFLSLLWTGINSFVTCRWRISYQTVGDSPWLLYNRQVSILSASAKSDDVLDATWFPLPFVYEDDIFNTEKQRELESSAVQLAAQLVRKRLVGEEPPSSLPIPDTVKGRFMDLACDHEGEMVLEDLFCDQLVVDVPLEVLQGAVMVLQSLAIMGLSVGLMGPPEQLRRMVAHLDSRNDPSLPQRDLRNWDGDSVRRLKHRLDRTPAIQLLAELHWKRTPQGAFDLLVGMGVWKKHEDLALLRSGFPLRFTMAELKVADKAAQSTHDPDALLGIRQDFRGMKVYTIDSASTSEIDDGVSLERIPREDGSQRHRIWVHIADADQWADEDLLEVARRRITSLYLPSGSFSMLPSRVSTEVMSLRANHDAFALSLGVELNDDGSVNVDSITMTPSLIRVNYRLTYDDVDEMLEEGSAYSEEWQLGALLDAAVKRRDYRIRNGSSEGFVPNPIPSATLSAFPDPKAPDGVAISHNVQVSHNAGKNQTSLAEGGSSDVSVPVSSAYLLVTESMILAGEAIGLWKTKMQEVEKVNGSAPKYPNRLELPFRTQPPPGESAIYQSIFFLDTESHASLNLFSFCRFEIPVTRTKGHDGLARVQRWQWLVPSLVRTTILAARQGLHDPKSTLWTGTVSLCAVD